MNWGANSRVNAALDPAKTPVDVVEARRGDGPVHKCFGDGGISVKFDREWKYHAEFFNGIRQTKNVVDSVGRGVDFVFA